MNILFITADQWRGDCLSSLGHPHVKTPNLDALAAGGVSFKRHYAQATPCGPSRTCLYTGMYLHNHGSLINGTPLDARHTNVAKEARKAGYKPALFGYTDTALDPRHYEIDDGYEGVLPGMIPIAHDNGPRKMWLADLKAKGYEIPEGRLDIYRPQPDYAGAENKGKTYSPPVFKAEDSRSAFLVDEAIKYISVRHEKPWFIHMSFFSPHPPYIVPEPYNSQYDADDMPLPVRRETLKDEAAQHPWMDYFLTTPRPKGWSLEDDVSITHDISELDLRQIKATYFGMISEVDNQLGRLLDYLKETGAYENTLIIFTSDHGEYLGDHWMFSKYSYFEQAFHIPLIICDPSAKADSSRGTVVDAFTESIDIMPTILETIGVDIPEQCDGHSLLPFCRGQKPEGWRQEYHAGFDLRGAYEIEDPSPFGLSIDQCMVNIIRGERYKYVHFAALPPVFFDLADDPDEFHNRADDPAYRGEMLEYTGKMLNWRMQYDGPALTDMHLTPDKIIHGLRSR
jgi:arylsulfatase A-like enzyme